MTKDFVHLRMHSQFSLTDGLINLKKVGHKALEAGMKALATTDLGVMFGSVIFYKNLREIGIKPILGCDVWIENPDNREDPSRLLILCRNHEGYHSLCELLSKSWLGNQWRGRAEIDPDWLNSESGDGLIVLSGFEQGMIGKHLLAGKLEEAKREARRMAELFPNRFYLELQRAGRPSDENLVALTLELAQEVDLPVVATNPILFIEKEDFEAHDARVCVSHGWTLSSRSRPHEFTPEQYFKSVEEMTALFADIPSAIENTVEIAKRCNLELQLGKPQLPLFPTPEGMSLDDYMIKLSWEGLDRRMRILYPNEADREAAYPRYKERLQMEIDIITKMKFPGYFLIVQDFINWGKTHECPVGPGRGSGAGSLVAYSLGITDLDPLEYDLLFERFLNPERVSMPDFDVDFCQNNRGRVIEYVKSAYGADAVSQIATFGTMAAKGVIRDVGRVLDIPFNEVDEMAKLIPTIPGKNPSLMDVYRDVAEFREKIKGNPTARRIFELAVKLEGTVKSIGMHAGGVLIAPGKLTDFCPLYCADMLPENVVSMYDKKDVEAVGLVKFDFLGLTTLTIIERALKYIEQNTGVRPDVEHVNINDAAAFEIFRKGDTVAVFQFESPGMRKLLIDAQPTVLKDLIALNALYRPGPMDLIPDYLAIKKGEKEPEYADPRIIPVLEETYGIMVYQEQVMRVAQVIGGYSLGGADILRRAMGKKDVAEMERQSKVFIEGAAKNGVSEEVAMHLFELMRKFAGYGFNKSHAAAYSFVAYQTAWLKAHHPAEFLASNMCESLTEAEKLLTLITDAKKHGVTVLPPDVNASDFNFTAPDTKTIRYGLGGIKGVGEEPANAIALERRKNGPFKDLFDMAERVGPKALNRRVLEALAMAGAFDSIDKNRHMWYVNATQAMSVAQDAQKNASQFSLFDTDEKDTEAILIKVKPWSLRRRALEEKQILGLDLTAHLFDEFEREVRKQLGIGPLSGIGVTDYGSTTRIAGILTNFRIQTTKDNTRMGVLTLNDGGENFELVLYREMLDQYRPQLKANELVVAEISVYKRKGSDQLSTKVISLKSLEAVRKESGCFVEIYPEKDADPEKIADALKSGRVSDHTNDLPVSIRFVTDSYDASMPLGQDYWVPATSDFLDYLNGLESIQRVDVLYPRGSVGLN